jgi:2',3'-cyclic-nucleotide 2'-phosphodiesterase (5'-nucleotidase family)
VARRATVIKQVRNASKVPVLLLDAGNALIGQDLSVKSKGMVTVDAMNAMGYDAMAIGSLDLEEGLEAFLNAMMEAHFAAVACNVIRIASGKLLLQPYTIIQRNGARFGVLGVSSPELSAAADANGQLGVLDAAESMRKYLPEVRKQSDVVIVLSQLGLEGNKVLAEAVTGLDIIVSGGTSELLESPVQVGDTLVVQAGYNGEWLGRLDARLEASGKLTEPKVQIITLGTEITDDPDLAQLVEDYKQLFP